MEGAGAGVVYYFHRLPYMTFNHY